MTQDTNGKGFAVAAGETSIHAIRTSAEGLHTEVVDLPCGAPAYVARPHHGENFPVVLIAQEIFGLHEHICDVARRFAKIGLFAIAPDYLIRHGDPMAAADMDAIRAIAAKAPDVETMGVFDEALAYAAGAGADASHAAIAGFCWGGRIAWLYAAHNPGLAACVPWYGRLDGPRTAAQPRWPIDLAAEIKVQTLGIYAGDDPSIPLDLVYRMKDSLTEAGAPADIIVYDHAPHGFFADYRPTYRVTAAHDAWGRMLAFLRAQGVG